MPVANKLQLTNLHMNTIKPARKKTVQENYFAIRLFGFVAIRPAMTFAICRFSLRPPLFEIVKSPGVNVRASAGSRMRSTTRRSGSLKSQTR